MSVCSVCTNYADADEHNMITMPCLLRMQPKISPMCFILSPGFHQGKPELVHGLWSVCRWSGNDDGEKGAEIG